MLVSQWVLTSLGALALIGLRLRESHDRCMTYNEHEDQQELFFDLRYGMESDKSGTVKYAVFWSSSRYEHLCDQIRRHLFLSIVTIMTRLKGNGVVSIERSSQMR
jgi:hypothetical protein